MNDLLITCSHFYKMDRFVILDEKIIGKEDLNISWLYADETFVLTQKTWFGFGGIPLIEENIHSLSEQIEYLQLPVPKILYNHRELFRLTKRMLNKNRFFRSGHILFQFYWNNDSVFTLISSVAFVEFEFPFSKHGLLVNYSDVKVLADSPINHFLFSRTINWKTGELKLRNTNLASSIVLNEKDVICEALYANIYFVKKGVLITPSAETGCYIDVTRNFILENAPKIGLKVLESKSIHKNDIPEMDEIFLCSEERGIQWILGVDNKRFVHHYSARIHQLLNDVFQFKAKRQ